MIHLHIRVPTRILDSVNRLIYLSLLLVAFAAESSQGQPPRENERAPDTIKFPSSFGPSDMHGTRGGVWGRVIYVGGDKALTSKSGEKYHHMMCWTPDILSWWLQHRREENPDLPEKYFLGEDCYIHLPPIVEGTIVPIFGGFYKLGTVIGNGERGGGGAAMFERLDAKNTPTGISFQADSIPLYLQQFDRGVARIHDCFVKVVLIEPQPKTSPVTYSATITLVGSDDLKYEAKAKVGDYLSIRGRVHKVRGIVPRDEKTKIVGWVELDSMSYSEATMTKNKLEFIKPTPVPKK